MSLQAVLFDLDGTLIDTATDFVATMAIQCARHGVTPPSDLTIRNTVSNGARALVSLCFGVHEGDASFPALRQELLDVYKAELGKNATLFEQVGPTLNQLDAQGIPWGIVTNKPRLYTELLLERMNLAVAVVVCPDDVTHTKPDPEPMLLACNTLNINPSQTLYLGDHERDIEAGRNANMQTIACTWGYIAEHIDTQSWQADFIAHTGNDLLSILHQFDAKTGSKT